MGEEELGRGVTLTSVRQQRCGWLGFVGDRNLPNLLSQLSGNLHVDEGGMCKHAVEAVFVISAFGAHVDQ